MITWNGVFPYYIDTDLAIYGIGIEHGDYVASCCPGNSILGWYHKSYYMFIDIIMYANLRLVTQMQCVNSLVLPASKMSTNSLWNELETALPI